MQLATVLDPRIKKLGFRTADQSNNASRNLVAEVTTEMNKQTRPENEYTVHEAPNNQNVDANSSNSLLSFLDFRVVEAYSAATPTSDAIISVRQYLEKPPLSRVECPIEFWDKHECRFTRKTALKYLCIPATSVPAERVFSKAGLFMTDRRNRIKPNNLDKLIFLRSNLCL
jgi:hypothetical protein